MSEAPERIWMDPDIKFPECEKQYGSDVEYVRADRIEELEAENKRLRLEVAHANDTADAAIERTKELEAALPEQIEWVKRLADDLNAAEGREARLKAKLAMVLKAWETEDDCEEDPDYGPQSSTWWAAMHKAIAELKGGKHEDKKSDR